MELDNVAATINTAIGDLVVIRDIIGILSDNSTKIEINNVICHLQTAAELLNNTEKTDEACMPKVLPIMTT